MVNRGKIESPTFFFPALDPSPPTFSDFFFFFFWLRLITFSKFEISNSFNYSNRLCSYLSTFCGLFVYSLSSRRSEISPSSAFECRPSMASQAAPPDGDSKKLNTTESVVFSPSASSHSGPESRDGGDLRPADYDSETVEKVYR
jgi:hypothetical protein